MGAKRDGICAVLAGGGCSNEVSVGIVPSSGAATALSRRHHVMLERGCRTGPPMLVQIRLDLRLALATGGGLVDGEQHRLVVRR